MSVETREPVMRRRKENVWLCNADNNIAGIQNPWCEGSESVWFRHFLCVLLDCHGLLRCLHRIYSTESELAILYLMSFRARIVGWSKTMIEKQRVPGSSPAWKQKDFSSRAATHSLLGTRGLTRGKHGCSEWDFRSLTTFW